MAHFNLRQYELDFLPDPVAVSAAGPCGIRPRLLILGCSASKAAGDGLTARQRYTGPLWQTLKAVDPKGQATFVAYLSARYGLGDSRSEMPHYNTKLTRSAADLMVERGLDGFYPYYPTEFRTERARLNHLASRERLRIGWNDLFKMQRDLGRAFESVAICGGGHYVRVASRYEQQLRDEEVIAANAPLTIINDQIGYMRSQLRAWLTE